jgi:hypothetical protein
VLSTSPHLSIESDILLHLEEEKKMEDPLAAVSAVNQHGLLHLKGLKDFWGKLVLLERISPTEVRIKLAEIKPVQESPKEEE